MMKFHVHAYRVVIILIGIGLVFLTVYQTRQLNTAIRTNNTLLTQKMDESALHTAEVYRKIPGWADRIHRSIVDHGKIGKAAEKWMGDTIADILEEQGLPRDFTFGIYSHENEDNILMAGTTDRKILSRQLCRNHEQRDFGWARLTCGYDYGEDNRYHLAVIPAYDTFVFQETKEVIAVSALLLILIGLCLWYLLYEFQRQRKLTRLKDDFINSLTHEFNTPLFAMSLASKALRQNLSVDGDKRHLKYLDVLDQEGGRLKSQVNKILQLAMMEADRDFIKTEEIDLHELLEEVVNQSTWLLDQKKGRIRFRPEANRSRIRGDRILIRNAIQNLVDNAIKYCENTAAEIILTTENTNKESITLNVKDNGVGIPSNQQSLIFQRFHQSKPSEKQVHNGFGLGLHYVKKVMEKLEGEVHLSSTVGKGSTFSLIFPTR